MGSEDGQEEQDGIQSCVESSGSALRTREAVRSGLSDLLARVENASGPDRELDAAIEVAARWIEAGRIGLKPEHRARWRSSRSGAVADGFTEYQADPFTASLDAALALVERLGLNVERLMGDAASETYRWVEHVSDYRQRLVLSILAALLRALQNTHPTKAESHDH